MKKTTYLLIVALLIANIFTGCTPQAESISGLLTYQVDVGKTVSLNLTVLPEDVQDKTLAYVSSAEDVAKVDDAGTVEGISAGSARITAKAANGISLEVDVTVTQPVDSISAEESLTLDIGLSGCVNAQIKPQGATDPTLSYLSDDEQVATVDATGQVTAISAGETFITITAHNGQYTKTIIIVETAASEVQIDKTELTIYTGGTSALTAAVLPEDTTHPALTWASTDENIATVDENGVVTGIAPGEATITASTQNEVSAACTITVIKQPAPTGTSGGGTGGGNTGGGSDSSGGSNQGGQNGGGGSSGDGSSGDGGGGGGGQPAPTQLTDDQIKTAIAVAEGHARGLGFTIVGTRQPGHGIASTAYYDYDAFLENLKGNVNSIAEMFAGENLSLVNLCFVQEGNSVYVTYG